MEAKKEEKKKPAQRKPAQKKTSTAPKTKKVKVETPNENVEKQETNINHNPSTNKNFEIDLTRDFNESSTFDVEYYREVFMELRKQMDELSLKRGKNDEAYREYDEAVYNITSNSVSSCEAQDFLGYCYKKGFYDFCIMNYEKYMKWTLLAAANGNAFSVSKLQVYLTTALDSIDYVDHETLLDFLDITNENYILFLSKLLCTEIVEILGITTEELVKMPEKYMEQNEEVQKVFDKAKMEAAQRVQVKLQNAAKILNDELERQDEIDREIRQREKEIEEKERKKEEQEKQEEIKQEKVAEEQKEQNMFKRKPGIKKKFRY